LLRFCFIFTLFSLGYQAFSQNQQKADSIKSAIAATPDLSVDDLMDAYFWLSAYSTSPAEELKYGKQLLDLAISTGDLENQIKANTRIGVALRLMGNLTDALEYLFLAADLAIEQADNVNLMATIYVEISACYTQYGDLENALLYGQKTIEMLEQTDDKIGLALTQLNVGYDFYLANKYEKALSYYNASEPILRDGELILPLAYLKGNKALVYWKKGQIEKAKKGVLQVIKTLESFGDSYGMADYYNQLGFISIDEKKYAEAIAYANQSLAYAQQEGLKEQIRDAFMVLYLAYSGNGSLDRAIHYQTQYHAYNDSIQNLKINQRLANLRTEFEVSQKQNEVDLLLEQRRNNRIAMVSGTIILFVVILLVIVIYLYLRAAKRHLKATESLNTQLKNQKEELVSLNTTKDKLFSIISHDLRGPIGNMSNLVYLYREMIKQGNLNALDELTEKMEDTTKRLVNLLDNLLNWAVQQIGQVPFDPQVLKIEPLLREVVQVLQDMASAKDLTIDFECQEETTILGDGNAISTVFRNLISNAIKFTNKGGTIKVIVEKSNDMGYVAVKIADNGIGIEPQKLNDLLNLGALSSTSGTSGETGTGLGLQLVKEFVDMNNGRLEIESTVGKGSVFTVHLPQDHNRPTVKSASNKSQHA
jgi:signal transduction histidine kinase